MRRRAFLRGLTGTAVGSAVAGAFPATLAAGIGRHAPEVTAPPGDRLTDALPRPVVGLRSLGGDFVFDPPGLLLDPGEELTWLNVGDFHTATAFHPAHDDLLPGEVPLRIPEAAEPFHSGMLGLDGTQFAHRFTVPGVYDYFCQPHYSFGMVGRLVIGEPRDGPAVREGDAGLNEASRARMPAVGEILGPGGRTYHWAARMNGLLLARTEDASKVPDQAEALWAAVEADETLGALLERAGAREGFRERLAAFLEAAPEIDYERLVHLRDAVSAPLARARRAA